MVSGHHETFGQVYNPATGQESGTANRVESMASRSAEVYTGDSTSMYTIAETRVNATGHGDPSYGQHKLLSLAHQQ